MNTISNLLISSARDCGWNPRSYSGRGMFGKSCVGIEVERGQGGFGFCARLVASAKDCAKDDDEFADFVAAMCDLPVREDSLGLGVIIYFPSLPFDSTLWHDASEDSE